MKTRPSGSVSLYGTRVPVEVFSTAIVWPHISRTIAFYRDKGVPEPRATAMAASEDYL